MEKTMTDNMKCLHCGEAFPDWPTLNEHYKSHEGMSPYIGNSGETLVLVNYCLSSDSGSLL